MRPVDGPAPYPAENARGGETILRSPMRRIALVVGLVGIVVLLLALRLVAAQQ
jgi:hypothetical protein